MKRTNESGRSMVEMLGVLAIIGVLSIGGIAGYSMAMNRYRANEALDMATKFAVILYSSYQTSQATGNTSWTAKNQTLESAGLVATGQGSTTPGGAEITVKAVDNDKVTLTIDFKTDGVCKAGASILGVTGKCTGESSTSFDYEFKQS